MAHPQKPAKGAAGGGKGAPKGKKGAAAGKKPEDEREETLQAVVSLYNAYISLRAWLGMLTGKGACRLVRNPIHSFHYRDTKSKNSILFHTQVVPHIIQLLILL